MKICIFRVRPAFPHSHIHTVTASFPSGHAVNGLIFVLIILYCLHYYNFVYWIVLIIWVLLVGWSRIALGAHWFSDIIAGWGCAMMWFAFMVELRGNVYVQKLLNYIL